MILCLLNGMVSVRGRTPVQRCADLFQIGEVIHFFIECLVFLTIIPLAEVSKQSCSRLKYAACICIYAFQICVRSFER